uniref:Acetyltransf_18 domain-containing protein n=1 Tax=Panagrellus redivivus TaxID=6233 RepID=A0A7E5A0D8_PANRE
MLATSEIRNLVQSSKIERALSGNLLPANNNPSFLNLSDVYTATVVENDPKGAVPVAFGLFNHCSPSQVYASIVSLKKGYENNFVAIKPVKGTMGVEAEHAERHTCYEITEVRDTEEDVSSMPQYYSAFEVKEVYPLHQRVVDALIDQTIGHTNMDMKRNLTVDLYDAHTGRYSELDDHLWRDCDGFIVADRYRFAEIEISRAALTNILQKTTKVDGVTFEPLNAKTSAAFLEYDSEIAIADRSEYLEYLFGLSGVKGTVVFDETKRPAGYVLSLGNHIFQVYGETADLASTVLAKHVSQMMEPTLNFFQRIDQSWISKELIAAASVSRRVRRFHSRILPSQIKWSKVFVLNMGIHLY